MKKAVWVTLGFISLGLLSTYSAEALTCTCYNKIPIKGQTSDPHQTLSHSFSSGKVLPITEQDAEFIIKSATKRIGIMDVLVECTVFCQHNSYQNYYVEVPRKGGGLFRFDGNTDNLSGTYDGERAEKVTYKYIPSASNSGGSASRSGS